MTQNLHRKKTTLGKIPLTFIHKFWIQVRILKRWQSSCWRRAPNATWGITGTEHHCNMLIKWTLLNWQFCCPVRAMKAIFILSHDLMGLKTSKSYFKTELKSIPEGSHHVLKNTHWIIWLVIYLNITIVWPLKSYDIEFLPVMPCRIVWEVDVDCFCGELQFLVVICARRAELWEGKPSVVPAMKIPFIHLKIKSAYS